MRVAGIKRWAGFGKGTRSGRVYTSNQPSEQVLRVAQAAAAGEFRSKAAVIAGHILAQGEQPQGWDFAAVKEIAKRV